MRAPRLREDPGAPDVRRRAAAKAERERAKAAAKKHPWFLIQRVILGARGPVTLRQEGERVPRVSVDQRRRRRKAARAARKRNR